MEEGTLREIRGVRVGDCFTFLDGTNAHLEVVDVDGDKVILEDGNHEIRIWTQDEIQEKLKEDMLRRFL